MNRSDRINFMNKTDIMVDFISCNQSQLYQVVQREITKYVNFQNL